jgi:hypothetical protein
MMMPSDVSQLAQCDENVVWDVWDDNDRSEIGAMGGNKTETI